MATTPSSAPARNTRSGGPTMDEFRALESGQATLASSLTEQLNTLRTKQAADIDSVRGQMESTATEHNSRLDELKAGVDSILAAMAESSKAPAVPSDATALETPSTRTAVAAIRYAENDASWDRAVLRAIPLALRDRAAIWHSTLTDRQRANLCRFDAWYEALRENFSPHPSTVRRQARERAWDPDVEDILGYVFAKVALLKVAYPGYKEGEVVQEVAERLPIDIQMLLRQPHERQPSLVNLRAELRVQEVFWRLRHQRPLLRSTAEEADSSSSKKRTSTFAELATPSALVIAPTSSSSSRGSVAQRRGKPYSEDFDPSRLGQGKSPRTGKDTVCYRVPDTEETIWCERPCRRCGANHFDFAHDHAVSKAQVRFAVEEEDDGYPATFYVADSNNRDNSQSF
ncbi:hypothetical protein A4X13_0g6281 [Tilletia indica]|uniref:Uncharacterized protein n=1 Tax=Tilletia indica TaxID=43049 RepID=A0A8T8SPP3_9BASI|nr:hypothetical protein A4X13_0g6281 [Tilletia indica]